MSDEKTTETQPQEDAPTSLLVEVQPGLACLFGETVPAGVEVVHAPLFPDRAELQLREAVGTALGTAAVGLNLAAQAPVAAGAFQGLVQLSPATMQALQAGAVPLVGSTGANLGTLVNAGGQFAHSVQWTPAAAAGMATGLAAIGPAVAMLAIQVQLATITSLVEEHLELTDELLRTVRIERWAEVTGLHQTMLRAVEEARHIGCVSDPIWQNVAASEAVLAKVRTEFREKVVAHSQALQGKQRGQERAEYLRHHGEAILRDAQALIRAQSAWFTYQAIRAGHLYQRADSDPTAGRLLEKVAAEARAEHDRNLKTATELLRALYRQLAMEADLPGRPTLPFGKGKRAAKDVAHASRVLLEQLKVLGEEIGLLDPPIPTPAVAAFEEEVPGLLPKVLRWHLDPEEQLLALGSAKGQGWPLKDHAYIAVTDQRLLVADKDDLRSRGEVDTAVPLTDIRYVRFTPADNDGPKARARLDITTTDEDYHLTFDAWAAEDDHQAEVATLAQLLRSSMSLPASEVPASPLVQDRGLSGPGSKAELGSPQR